MSIGYACLVLGVAGTQMKSCRMNAADPETLYDIITHNLNCLENTIEYNAQNDIRLFRISSDLIPFGSSEVNSLVWEELFGDRLARIGSRIRGSGIRVSMHPGQYTVLNSPHFDVVGRAIADLRYHVRILDSLGTDASSKIILHIGGVYGDKQAALARFATVYQGLDESIKRRLVIENDDKSYSIGEVLSLGHKLGIPVVYDNLHNAVNCFDPTVSDRAWITECAATWRKEDAPQKIHYAQQDGTKKAGSHSETIRIDPFLAFYQSLPVPRPDIMLEVKDKNLSALKCIHCAAERIAPAALERAWARYKYRILEQSPEVYLELRQLLRNKQAPSALAFYQGVERAGEQAESRGNGVNAALHVWGYFENQATEKEKQAFFRTIKAYEDGAMSLQAVKRQLWKMTMHYGQAYLSASYYFLGLQ